MTNACNEERKRKKRIQLTGTSRRKARLTFICANTSMSSFVFIVPSVCVIESRGVDPGGTGIPGGSPASIEGSLPPLAPVRVRHCDRGSAGPGVPPSINSPRTVVLPSRKGSESARSILSGLPPTSTSLRLRTAERAVSWSFVLQCTWTRFEFTNDRFRR